MRLSARRTCSGCLRTSPTYMILDDHEIEDNWTQDRINDAASISCSTSAIGAYQSYQWSHGPRTYGRLLYYTFECAGYPVFVLDTRTQRYKDDQPGLGDNHLLGRPTPRSGQRSRPAPRLLDWLSDQQNMRGNVPKFIVTSSVFVPNDMSERNAPAPEGRSQRPDLCGINAKRRDDSDSWPAYPNTRLALLQHLVEKASRTSCSWPATSIAPTSPRSLRRRQTAPGLMAFAITSSAFYWPFPFADGDPNSYVHDSRAAGQIDPFPVLGTDAVMQYRSFGFTREDNFARIDLDRSRAR